MARPGPKSSGRVNEVKVMFDDRTFSALQVFMAANGITSFSEGAFQSCTRHLLGAIGSVPMLANLVIPEQANSRPQIRDQ